MTKTGKKALSFLLLDGLPINEQLVRYGLFVMNTEGKIRQTIEHYHAGRMGVIDFSIPPAKQRHIAQEAVQGEKHCYLAGIC